MNRRLLWYGITGLAISSVLLAAVPFLRSLNPNDRARSSALNIELSSTSPGHFSTIDQGSTRIYVMRLPDGQVSILAVPIKDGSVLMPDDLWRRPDRPCPSFVPSNADGRLLPSGNFQCHESDLDDYRKAAWICDYSGKYIEPSYYPIEDMWKPRLERHGDFILLEGLHRMDEERASTHAN